MVRNLMEKHPYLSVWLAAVLLMLMVTAPLLSSRAHIIDDMPIVNTAGEILESANPLQGLWNANASLILPITGVTYWADLLAPIPFDPVQLARFRVSNIFYAGLAALLLFQLLLVLKVSRGVATAAALLFAVHPFHVPTLGWISARKDILLAIFLLWAVLLYWRDRAWLALVPYALAILCKMSTYSLLNRILAYEILQAVQRRRIGASWNGALIPSLLRVLAFFGLSVLLLVFYTKRSTFVTAHYWVLDRVVYQLGVYTSRMAWPWPITYYYPDPDNLGTGATLASVFVLLAPLGLCALAATAVSRVRAALLLLCLSISFLIPYLIVVPNRLFISSAYGFLYVAGPIALLAMALEAWWPRRFALSRDAFAFLLVAVLAVASFVTSWNFRDPVLAMARDASTYPEDYYAQMRYGEVLEAAHQTQNALSSYQKAIDLRVERDGYIPADGFQASLRLAIKTTEIGQIHSLEALAIRNSNASFCKLLEKDVASAKLEDFVPLDRCRQRYKYTPKGT